MIVVGIAGGSGSGKSTFADKLKAHFGDRMGIIRHDYYYNNHPELSYEQRAALNYDVPEALETKLLVSHLKALKAGNAVVLPDYDFAKHLRKSEGIPMSPTEIVIVEGILVLESEELRPLLDIKLFVDTDPDIMATRRVLRDCTHRGRTPESCFTQYLSTVKPMLEKHVLPSRKYASLVISGNTDNSEALHIIISALERML